MLLRSPHRAAVAICALWIVAVPAPAPAEGATDVLTSGKKLYSQGNEELVIRDFFQDRRGGFFLDVGCSHYQKHSTTYYLEKHLGWSGIGIDALDYRAEYEKHRPATRFENYIVTDHSGTLETFYRTVSEGQRGFSSIYPEREFGGQPIEVEEIQVPTITLNELLEARGVEHLDLVSIDIERSAPAALAGFDIQRYRPALVVIEAGKGFEYRRTLMTWFRAHRYERIEKYRAYDKGNWYFRPQTEPSAPSAAD